MYLRYKQKIIIGVSLLIVVCLVVSSVFVYVQFFGEEKETITEGPVEKKIDDRISPYTNQGLILEINRIRHRGLLEKLLKIGTSWREKPSFYFISNMDDLEYVSKDVEALGSSSETLFNMWDTMFHENKVVRDVDEEQETSEITLTIVERVKKGLLGRRFQDFERDTIHVTYDYRTGRWNGDDNFRDYDGYGHYVGSYFEIWFNIYQIDADGDFIPTWTEVNVLGTNPQIDDSKLDPDGDGIPTAWEWRWGYDPHIWDDHVNLDPDIDGLENIEEYKMAKWFADPFSQDIYVEVDGMERGGFFDPPHVLWVESQQAIIERYCQHNIKLYIDHGWPDTPKNGGGELLPHYGTVSQDSGMILQFYNNYFPDERKGIFRYAVVGHSGNFNHPAKSNVYDTMHIGANIKQMVTGNLKKVFLQHKHPITPRAWRLSVGARLMHELCHTVGITPWSFEGCDNLSYFASKQARKQYDETWGNYYSVMNYYYLLSDMSLFDYSDGSNGPPYDQNDWEHLYLPTFQTDAFVVEEIYFGPPCTDKIVDELGSRVRLEARSDNWNYSEQLTQRYIDDLQDWSPIDPIKTDFRVFVKTDGANIPSDRNIRIYGKPIVEPTHAEWVLVKEGYVNEDGMIQWEIED